MPNDSVPFYDDLKSVFAELERSRSPDVTRRLAVQGDAEAQYNLGVSYGKGEGVPENDAEAAKWFRRAAEQGNVGAQLNLGAAYYNGHGVQEDNVVAYMWFDLAAAQGREDAREYRDVVKERMTREQTAEAQRLSREWKPKTE